MTAAAPRRAASPDPLDARIARLIAAQPEGCALLREFYADPAIFERDVERIFLRHWLLAGHESRIPRAGDYFVFEVAGESVIVVRGKGGSVRALLNVCRHRGSQVCYEKEGHARLLVCPYHAWSYDLEGRLKAARHMGKGFDRSRYRLKAIHARVVAGLVFVCFDPDPPAFDEATRVLGAALGRHGWAGARIAARASFGFAANWKLAVENYVECYHCAPAHPEYARHHSNERPAEKIGEFAEALARRAAAQGVAIPPTDRWLTDAADREEGAFCLRVALYGDALTGSEDGAPLAPLMGDFEAFDGGATFVHVGPASFFLAYADHGVAYRFTPRAPDSTELEVSWLVRADAREGEDYDRERLVWLWTVTSEEDKRIVEKNQAGVNSRYYRPGPYAPPEPRARRFAEWYRARIA